MAGLGLALTCSLLLSTPSGVTKIDTGRAFKDVAAISQNMTHSRPGFFAPPAPIPLASLQSQLKREISDTFNLSSIGRLNVFMRPYAGTAFYIGEHNGQHLFATSAHLENRHAHSITFEPDSGFNPQVEIPLQPQALFSSVLADIAIFAVDSKRTKPQSMQYLQTLTPMKFINQGLHEVLQDPQKYQVQVLVAGRAMLDHFNFFRKSNSDLWNSSVVDQYWNNPTVKGEALRNGGVPNVNEGDVFVVAPTQILAQGQTLDSLDPDGAQTIEENIKNGGESTAYLASTSSWIVRNLALTNVIVGRMSGSPVIVKYTDLNGITHIGVAGLSWTGPTLPRYVSHPTYISSLTDPNSAFPDVIWGEDSPHKDQLSNPKSLYLENNKEFTAMSMAAASWTVRDMLLNYFQLIEGGTPLNEIPRDGLVGINPRPLLPHEDPAEVYLPQMDTRPESVEVLKQLFGSGFFDI